MTAYEPTWGGAAADARAQSSRSCARSSADLPNARGHSHRRTRARSSERDRALPLRVRPPLERGAAEISGCHLSLSQQGFSQHRARGTTNDFRWPRAISSSLSTASPMSSGRVEATKPIPLVNLDRWPAHVGLVRHGGGRKPFSTMICGRFSLSRPSPSNVLELLPPVLHLRPAADREWLETILQRMVTEAALQRPGQLAVLSRMTEVLFVEVLRSMDQIPWSRRRWVARCNCGPVHRQGASADPRTPRAPLDAWRAGTPGGARPLGLRGSFY